MVDKKELANRLKAIRVLHGKTQVAMSEIAGVSPQQWHKYEAGTDMIGAEPLTRICLEFRLSADVLLGISTKGKESIPNT